MREGRNWLTHQFPTPPRFSALPPEEAVPAGKVAALEIREGWFRYERTGPDVLKGLCFSVPQGALYAIVGGNGSGKSTTLKTACGICKLYRGSVRVFGKPLQAYRGRLFDGCLSMLPQDPKCIFVKQTVLDDLKEMSGNTEKIQETARLCQIDHLLHAHPADLSGGELQRAALAKVLLTQPKLLLLDEPMNGLDPLGVEELRSLFCSLAREGKTLLVSSHILGDIAAMADTVGILSGGSIRREFHMNDYQGAGKELFEKEVLAEMKGDVL